MELSEECPTLSRDDVALLERIAADLPILADLSRADLLLYGWPSALGEEAAVIIGQAQPHSVSPIHAPSRLGYRATRQDDPVLFHALHHPGSEPAHGSKEVSGTPTIQDVYPVRSARGTPLGALSIETNLVEYERHGKRSIVFRMALARLQQMGLCGELQGAANLSAFAEHDGIIFVDTSGRIRYVSGIAENLHRKLGYTGKLLKRSIKGMGGHDSIFQRATEDRRCVEAETQEGQLIWIRKALPIAESPPRFPWSLLSHAPQAKLSGVLITIHDATDARRKEQELRIKAAMIQEIHHRVKNNLQTIAALLRLQSRRITTPRAQIALQESVNRILSVAVVHEFLSHDESSVINIKEMSQRILAHTAQGIMDPSKGIRLTLQGEGFAMPAQRATACALVINELVQNAVEHGYTDRRGGNISLDLREEGDQMVIEVADDGEGLPAGFDLSRTTSLGLKIVQTLVKEDLRGSLELINGRGVRAVVRFPKVTA